jgi:dihydrofolate reductase
MIHILTIIGIRRTNMRKVAAWLFITLDGVVESPEKWQDFPLDDDMNADINAQIATEGAILLGRGTYEAFAQFWPTSEEEPFASHINNTPKYVVSTTLSKAEWGKWDKPTLIKGNLAKELSKLKQQPGKNIGVSGSPTLVRSLLQDNLLDELKLMIHPVIVGKGKRLFDDGGDLKRLQLIDSKVSSTGVVILTYQPVNNGNEK